MESGAMLWETQGTVILGSTPGYKVQQEGHVMAFDMDGTLITPVSGKRFPKSAQDWRFIYDGVVIETLQKCHGQGMHIVIFTNQKGVSTGIVKAESLIQKLDSMQKVLGFPLECYMATEGDQNRKPGRGMWDMFLTRHGIDHDKLATKVFVGDAAGRPRSKSWSADHSDFDILFAQEAGLTFKTPEMFFLGKHSQYKQALNLDKNQKW